MMNRLRAHVFSIANRLQAYRRDDMESAIMEPVVMRDDMESIGIENQSCGAPSLN